MILLLILMKMVLQSLSKIIYNDLVKLVIDKDFIDLISADVELCLSKEENS